MTTWSDRVAARITELRHLRKMTGDDLASACVSAGAPEITRSVLANIETGRRDADGRRRRDVTVDELVAFARALGVPVGAILPADAARHADPSWFTMSLLDALHLTDVQAAIREVVSEVHTLPCP